MQELVAALIGALVMVFLVRIPRRVMPRHYFELHEIIHGMNNALTWPGVLIRFSIPFVVGAVEGLAVRQNEAFVGGSAAFLAALLLVWPGLLDSRLLPYAVARRKTSLYLVYAMFIASFTVIGLAGAQIGQFAKDPLRDLVGGEGLRQVASSARSRLDELVIGVVASGLALLLTRAWQSVYTRVQRR
jgi:hypothetical protein